MLDEDSEGEGGFSLVVLEEVSEELSPDDVDEEEDDVCDDEDEELEDELPSPSGSTVCLPLQYLSLISGT